MKSMVHNTVQEEDVRDGEGFLDTIWYHSLDASVSVVAKTWIMRVLELITGNSVSSYSGTGAEAIHFGEASAITPPSVRLRMKVQAKDHNSSDATTYAWVYIFKATASFPSFSMEEVTPNSMELNFRGLRVTDDDAGATIAKAYGRLELGSSS